MRLQDEEPTKIFMCHNATYIRRSTVSQPLQPSKLEMQQLNELQQQFIEATRLLQGKQCDQGEQIIMGMRKYVQEFIQTTFEIATMPQLQVDIFVRQVASVELKNEIDRNIRNIDMQLFMNILQNIIPAGAIITNMQQNQTITNNLCIVFQKMYEYIILYHTKYQIKIDELAVSVFNKICEAINMESVYQTEFTLKVFTIFIKESRPEKMRQVKESAIEYFYQSFLQNLIIYFVNEINFQTFGYPKLIIAMTKALRSIFDPSEPMSVYSKDPLTQIPIHVTNLFQKLQINDSFEYQNAKEDCFYILIKYINKIRKTQQFMGQNEAIMQFQVQWQQYQKQIAQAILNDIKQCESYDLFADYESINSVFMLAGELIERQSINSEFYHPEAAQEILSNAYDLVQSIFKMIINAANVRMEHFKNDDLLVIDCLRPSVDLIRQICENNMEIEKQLNSQAEQVLSAFINNQLSENDYRDKNIEANIFLGTLLIRRGLPNVSRQIKNIVCLQGIKNCKFIHEIVFEEISKLIIQVTYDDYNLQSFTYNEGSSFDVALQLVQNNENDQVVPLIVDLMVQLYCSDVPGQFQQRMLSGILSRPVRQEIIPVLVVERLMKRSIIILFNNTNVTQHGGMVTLLKTCLGCLKMEIVDQILCQLLSEPPYNQLPEIIKQTPNNILIVENAFNVLNTALVHQCIFSNRFESLLVKLVTDLLQINFDLSQTLFSNLNQLIRKEIVQTVPQFELLDQIILGLASLPETKEMYNCFQHALPYIKFVITRHLLYMKMNQNKQPSIFQLVNNLVSRNTLIAQSFACYIMGNIIDIANRYHTDLIPVILNIFFPYFRHIFGLDFKVLCNIVRNSQNVHDISNYIEPETKRMCLFYLSYFWFIFIGTTELAQSSQMISQLLQQDTYQTTGITCIFTAVWAMQDLGHSYGAQQKRTLAQYVLISIKQLTQYYGSSISVTWPCILWAKYIIQYQLDYEYPKPPHISFGLLQQTKVDIPTLQVVFDNLYSKALLHAQQNDNIECPFWNRNEASYFGEALKFFSESHDERSNILEIVGKQIVMETVSQQIQAQDKSVFPEAYQNYFNQIQNYTGQSYQRGPPYWQIH